MPYKDKNKQKEYQHERYERNKEKYREGNKKRRLKLVKKLFNYKSSLSCLYCGKNNPAFLDFHHSGDKTSDVSDIARETHSWDRMLEEIKRCDVVCANCHRKLHKNDNKHRKYLENTDNVGIQRKRETIRWFYEYKRTLKCEHCGECEACCIDFHHVGDKIERVSILASRGHSKNKILNEIEKCKILCANCHRKLHWEVIHTLDCKSSGI